MYSGSTLTKYSGRVMGAHQKIDRVARKHLGKVVGTQESFPGIREILHFEGKNGPDAIKRKSPAKDELWHYFDPFDDDDTQIFSIIDNHYRQLVTELKDHNQERISFEAAWLAHGIVDGLTPAHHYPYEKELTALRGGEGIEGRTTIREKLVMPGANKREQVKNNWRMWGPKGLMSTHALFEFGVASIIAPLSFSDVLPTLHDLKTVEKIGVVEQFRRTAREIAVLDMYVRYQEKGWTPKLAYEVRHKLGPLIIKCVTLSWYAALVDAKQVNPTEVHENHSRKSRRKNLPKPQNV